ncbi:MAG: gephyrin-like molybdotransferase Glp [Paracoccaceae bacterium]
MIPVSEALDHLFRIVAPLSAETAPLREAAGRVLAETVTSNRTQPPFAASAMDGYAVKGQEVERDCLFKVVGEAAAGHAWAGTLGAGQAVRIFTGAPLPAGSDCVVIQEDVARKGDLITVTGDTRGATHVRPAGGDFHQGDPLTGPRVLNASDVALLASMNIASVPVMRRPVVALISTGDELVMPGETPGPDQIIASNTFGLAAMLEAHGAQTRILPIARDTKPSLQQTFELADGADLIVTIGGASVGDHDLVADVAADLGMEQAFYKIAMRPGKPLMAGRLGETPMMGLPGNPVSALVCGRLFLVPVIQKMLGLGEAAPTRFTATLSRPLDQNGPREHYMRARLQSGQISAFDRQDSSLLTVLASANVLLVRPPHDVPRDVGETVSYISL